MKLCENIYRLRTEKNMSQGDLADALDVSRQSVSKWENDSAIPELDKLVKMAEVFGVTLDELVNGQSAKDIGASTSDPLVPPQSHQHKAGLTPQQILGIVLLSFGALCLIVFTVVGIFTGEWLLGIAISLPILLCGAICLLCKCNVGLKCAWSVYLCLWVLLTIFAVR